MGQFTAQELDNIANSALDFHMDKGKVWAQHLQDRPLYQKLLASKKTFPGGKDNITTRVKGDRYLGMLGFSGDDTVTYGNPTNTKVATYPWKEIHDGIKVTLTELKKDGISVVDSTDGKSVSSHSQRDVTALANMFDEKLGDLTEGLAYQMNEMVWKDGSQSAKEVPGIRSFLLDDPTSATVVGGIDQSANTWWRNRASLLLSTTTPSDMTIIKKMKSEDRQLRKFGAPKHIRLCGSDFLDALEAEIYSKGTITNTGWSNSGQLDIGQADAALKGTTFQYDPTLDDLGLAKYSFVIDTKAVFLDVMEGEDMKAHSPARPEDKYVLYRALTWTGGLVCKQRNTSGVYSIA